MDWIIIGIALMVIAFFANVLLTPECDHDWEAKGEGDFRCKKCKKRSTKTARLNV